MPATEQDIREALHAVREPCSIAMRNPMDIVEMGLVQGVEVAVGRVRVTLVLTDPSCVHYLPMRRYIADVLLALDGVQEVEVAMSTSELWTPDRMQPRQRRVTIEG
jgi:metal-sulfur cluster biosynthetic enzyme